MESNQISQDIVTPFLPLNDVASPPENLKKAQNRPSDLSTEFRARTNGSNDSGRMTSPRLPAPDASLGDPAYDEASKALDKLNDHVGTDMQSLMTFFHELMILMRKQSRENRALMRDAQMNELQEAADKIRSAAKKQLIAGVAMGALTMAGGALTHSQASLAVAVTGIAGPDGGTPEKPVGFVCFAAGRRDQAMQSECVQFGDLGRADIRRQSVERALGLLLSLL